MTETGVTAGPWKLEPTVEMHGRQYGPWNIVPVDPDVMVLRSGSGGAKSYSRDIVSFDNKDADLENGRLIVSAVNVCFSLNPDHPEDVPGLIPEIVRMVRRAANTPPEDGHGYTENCHCLRCDAASALARLDTKKEDGDAK